MSTTPRVFLSSTIKGASPSDPGLGPYRKKIHDLVVNRFGWECLCSGVNDDPFWGAPIQACVQGVQQCDLFICLLWKARGSMVDYQRVTITEHELYTALNSEKAILIYVIDADERDPSLQALINVLTSDMEMGLCIRTCALDTLEQAVARDLRTFRQEYYRSKTVAPLRARLFLRAYLKRLLVSLWEPRFVRPFSNGGWDSTRLQQLLEQMDRLHALQDHARILECGGSALSILHHRPPLAYPRTRLLWLHFLKRWYGACNWLGLLEGSFGSLSAARAAMEIARLSEDFTMFHAWAGIMGNTLYTLGMQVASGDKLPGRTAAKTNSELDQILDRALAYNSLAFFRQSDPDVNVVSSRASLLFQRGRMDESRKLFEAYLWRVQTSSEHRRITGLLGRIHLRQGRGTLAETCLTSSVEGSWAEDPGAQVRCHRNYAEALAEIGEISASLDLLKRTSRNAKRFGFLHQAGVCDGILAGLGR